MKPTNDTKTRQEFIEKVKKEISYDSVMSITCPHCHKPYFDGKRVDHEHSFANNLAWFLFPNKPSVYVNNLIEILEDYFHDTNIIGNPEEDANNFYNYLISIGYIEDENETQT